MSIRQCQVSWICISASNLQASKRRSYYRKWSICCTYRILDEGLHFQHPARDETVGFQGKVDFQGIDEAADGMFKSQCRQELLAVSRDEHGLDGLCLLRELILNNVVWSSLVAY